MGKTESAVEQSFHWVAFELFEELVKIYEYEAATESEDIVAAVLQENPIHVGENRPFSEVLRERAGISDESVPLVVKGHAYQVVILGNTDRPVSVLQLRKSISPEKAYPPLLTQAASLVKTAARSTMRAVTTGRVLAPEEVVRKRWDLCHACEEWDEKQSRCMKCGCFSKAKNALAESECPIGKWGPYKEGDDGVNCSTST